MGDRERRIERLKERKAGEVRRLGSGGEYLWHPLCHSGRQAPGPLRAREDQEALVGRGEVVKGGQS